MGKQLIITVGREFGSGGHIIAVKLAEHFGIQLLDSNILAEVAKKSNASEEYLKKYDESARNLFFSRTVNGFSNSPEEIIAQMQFDYIKQKSARALLLSEDARITSPARIQRWYACSFSAIPRQR